MLLPVPYFRAASFRSLLWNAWGSLFCGLLFGVTPLVMLTAAVSHFDLSELTQLDGVEAAQAMTARCAGHAVREIRLAEDGTSIWISRFPAIIQQIDLPSRRVITSAKASTAFASDLQMASPRRQAVVYEDERGAVVQSFYPDIPAVIIPTGRDINFRFAVNPVRDRIAMSRENRIQLLSLDSSVLCQVALEREVSRAVWSPDGTRLLVSLSDGTLQVLDGEGLIPLQSRQSSLLGHANLLWGQRGQHVAVFTSAGEIAVWDLVRDNVVSLKTNVNVLRVAALSPDGEWLAIPDVEDQVWLLAVGNADERHFLGTSPSLINALCFTADGSSLIVGGMEGRLERWSTMDGQVEWILHPEMSGHERKPTSSI